MFEWWQQLMKGEGRGEGGESATGNAEADDPEYLLTEAQRQMTEAHQRNRERAVQAITKKNQLLQMVDEYRRKAKELREQAARAEAAGRTVDALRLRDEASSVEVALRNTEATLQQAIETMEAVKKAIRREEETICRKAQEAVKLKVEWRIVQVEQALAKSRRMAEQSVRDPEQFRLHLMEVSDARDHLLTMVEEWARKTAELRVKAEMARKRGDGQLENALLREMEQAEANLDQTQEALNRASAVIDRLESILRGEQVEWVYVDPAADASAWADEVEQKENDRAVVAGLALAAVLVIALLLLLLFLSR